MEEHVQRYTTLETMLDVQGLQVCVTRIANFEELLEALDPITFAEDERLPLPWAELWPAAVAMAHYMTERLPLRRAACPGIRLWPGTRGDCGSPARGTCFKYRLRGCRPGLCAPQRAPQRLSAGAFSAHGLALSYPATTL